MKKFYFRVKKGDTLLSVCEKTNTLPHYVIKLNDLTEEIRSGDLLYMEIPDNHVYTVKPFDTVETINFAFNTDIKSINGIDYVYVGQKIYV